MSDVHVGKVVLSCVSMSVLHHRTQVTKLPSLIKTSRVSFVFKGRMLFCPIYYINHVLLIDFPTNGHGYISFLVIDNHVVMGMKDLTHCSHEEQHSWGS